MANACDVLLTEDWLVHALTRDEHFRGRSGRSFEFAVVVSSKMYARNHHNI